MAASEHALPISVSALDDASEQWYETAMNDRLWRIMGDIDYTDDKSIREKGQASLLRLADTCFDCENGSEFVVAVFNKFFWQVKRKIKDRKSARPPDGGHSWGSRGWQKYTPGVDA